MNRRKKLLLVETPSKRSVIGYVRVSTQDQAQNGLSLEAQQERLAAYALATGRVLSQMVVDDGRSAKSLDRPGMQGILAAIKAGQVASVIILKLDRLTRSVRDLGELLELFQEHDVDLISVSESLDTSSASGRMVMNIMATVGQWEREIIGERTETVLTHKRENSRVYGKTPMGFQRQGDSLIPDLYEQEILKQMRVREQSGESYCSIARWLNEEGVPPRQGGKAWYSASVIRVLTSRMAEEKF